MKRASFVDVSSIDAIAEFSLSSPQGFFAEGPPSVLRGRGPPSGIFVALIDDARRRFSLSNRAEASARIFALRSWGVSGTCKVGGVQKETRSFVRIANAGFVADADLMRSRRSAASALGGLGGVVGMISLSFAAAESYRTVCGNSGARARCFGGPTYFWAPVVSLAFGRVCDHSVAARVASWSQRSIWKLLRTTGVLVGAAGAQKKAWGTTKQWLGTEPPQAL